MSYVLEAHLKGIRALRDVHLRLEPLNVIVGANGTGKSTLIEEIAGALRLGNQVRADKRKALEHGTELVLDEAGEQWFIQLPDGFLNATQRATTEADVAIAFRFEEEALRRTTQFPGLISAKGENLPAELTRFRDADETGFQALYREFLDWFPWFSHVSPVYIGDQRGLLFRLHDGTELHAEDVSLGELVSLAILTVAFRNRFRVCAIDEPDAHLHPRLLKQLAGTLIRLAYPQAHGIEREPVQLLLTTHNPYFVDCFKDYPEALVLADRDPTGGVRYRRLTEIEHWQTLLGDAPLGDIWYSGILGGVPDERVGQA